MTVTAVSIGHIGHVGHVGHVGDADVTGFRLDNGLLRLEVWDLGATTVAVEVPDGHGGWADVVLRHADPARYADPTDRGGYLGATVGRYANRIAHSRFEFDGEVHELTANQGVHHLHGGAVGFDQRLWSAAVGDDAVTFTLVSPDGDQGYPGTLTAHVRYRIEGPTLDISYTAECDAPTVVNLTNHAYWNLAAGAIAEHVLTVRADSYLPVDDALIPTGEIAAVDGTRFDLRRGVRLGDALAVGRLDHCFLLGADDRLRDVAVLDHPPTGRSMTVATDQPAVQVYVADDPVPARSAVCLETQRPPNAPNDPALGPSVLRPGETYRHRTSHTFAGPGLN